VNRRTILKGAIAAPLVLSLPNRAWAQRRNPNDFGTVGAGDNTAAINGAAAAIRTDGYGVLEINGKNSSGYQRFYDVSALDLTNCNRCTVEIEAGIVVRASLQTVPAAIFDFAFAHEVHVENNGHIYGGLLDPWSSNPPAVMPLCGILIGGDSDKTLIDGQGMITGFFQGGCIAVISAVSVKVGGFTQLIQRWAGPGVGPPALMLSSNPGEWGVQSIFAPLSQGVNAVANFIYDGGEIHQVGRSGGEGSGWTVYLRNTQVAAFSDVLIGGSAAALVLFQGNNSDITMRGCCFRNDLANNPAHVLESQGNTVNVRLYAPSPNNLQAACSGAPWFGAFSGASGQF
jgi:hypothetical protein